MLDLNHIFLNFFWIECVALFDYNGEEGDLSFITGDVIAIIGKNGNWWEGACKGTSGTFPANYVQLKEVEVSIFTIILLIIQSGLTWFNQSTLELKNMFSDWYVRNGLMILDFVWIWVGCPNLFWKLL